MKRLYEVTAVVSAYILAEDQREAEHEGALAIADEARKATVSARLVPRRLEREPWHRADGWGPATLVYGADGEVTLDEAIKKYTEET